MSSEKTAAQRTIEFWANRFEKSREDVKRLEIELASVHADLNDRVDKHAETCASLLASNEAIRKELIQSTKEMNNLLEEKEGIEKELESAKAHVSRLVADLHDAVSDRSKNDDALKKSRWMQFATSVVLVLVSAVLIIKNFH